MSKNIDLGRERDAIAHDERYLVGSRKDVGEEGRPKRQPDFLAQDHLTGRRIHANQRLAEAIRGQAMWPPDVARRPAAQADGQGQAA